LKYLLLLNICVSYRFDTHCSRAEYFWALLYIVICCRWDELYTLFATGVNQLGVCVVESTCVNCFMDDGSEYQAPLPFQVSSKYKQNNNSW